MGYERLKWVLFKRFLYMNKISGFTAHWKTFLAGNSHVAEYSRLFAGAILYNCEVGRFSHIHKSVLAHTKVGAFCSIASNTIIGGGGEHPLNQVSTHAVFYSLNSYINKQICFAREHKFNDSLKPVTIGNDVWVGSDCIIKQGVTIGNGAVIASGSVVVKDVLPYAIVGGAPAKIIRYRHSQDIIELLIQSSWWEWSLARLQVISDMFDENVSLSIERLRLTIEKANKVTLT